MSLEAGFETSKESNDSQCLSNYLMMEGQDVSSQLVLYFTGMDSETLS